MTQINQIQSVKTGGSQMVVYLKSADFTSSRQLDFTFLLDLFVVHFRAKKSSPETDYYCSDRRKWNICVTVGARNRYTNYPNFLDCTSVCCA